jgi:hypothetical protein
MVIKGEDPEEDSDQGSGGHDNGRNNGTNNNCPHIIMQAKKKAV